MSVIAMFLLALASTAPAEAAGELTDAERMFQGLWDYAGLDSDHSSGTLRIDGRDFHADVVHGTYEGHVTVRPEAQPAQIDFTIEGCECKFDGVTAAGIYYEQDGTIVFATPAPGEPRPTTFTGLDPQTHEIVRLRRLDAAAAGAGE